MLITLFIKANASNIAAFVQFNSIFTINLLAMSDWL